MNYITVECYGLEYSGPNIQNRIAEVESVEIYLYFWYSASNIQGRRTEVWCILEKIGIGRLIACRTFRVGALRL